MFEAKEEYNQKKFLHRKVKRQEKSDFRIPERTFIIEDMKNEEELATLLRRFLAFSGLFFQEKFTFRTLDKEDGGFFSPCITVGKTNIVASIPKLKRYDEDSDSDYF
jgi:inner membrane protein involved in colicin E2 resistance